MKTFKEWKFDMLGKIVWLRPGMVMYGELEVIIPNNTYGQIVAKYNGINNQCFAIATDEPLETNSKIEGTLRHMNLDRIIWLNSKEEDGPKDGGWFPDIHFRVI